MGKTTAQDVEAAPAPVLWLLGKTGAGKTSVIRALTGEGDLGNGWAPGTRDAALFDFPVQDTAVRFLDTRGLGEAGHDPTPDLAAARALAQAVLVVMRLDDPVQQPVAEALRGVRLPMLLVHTGADLISDPQVRDAARLRAEQMIERAVGKVLPSVTLGLPAEGLVSGVESLLDVLDGFMPKAAAALRRADEARAFLALRPLVLRFATAAGAADIAPLVGVVAVPATQGAMLQALARHHQVTLTPVRLGLLASALGAGALVRLGASHALRQGIKLVPVAGQTLGAAAAAGASFATTYALGRAASAWLYGTARGAPPDRATLRALYDAAFRGKSNDAG